jgi:hypothetical protein
MEPSGAKSVLNIRPAVVLFFGADAFACRELYSGMLGRYADVQRAVTLSETAERDEWRELLQEAFQLFTAVSMKRLQDAHVISDAQVESVPIYIVVRTATKAFAALVETIVMCAQAEGLAEKLQFVTITDVSRSEELPNKAAILHGPVSATVLPHIALQNTVLAISDYWRGVRIGSNVQTQLALARITALFTLSEYSLEEGHLGFLRNGVLGGRTFWIGVGSYSADRLDVCAKAIYVDLLKEAIDRKLASNSVSVIGELQDGTYAKLFRNITKRTGRSIPLSGSEASTGAVYAAEIIPAMLESLCSQVRTKEELLATLESLARRLRVNANAPASCTSLCITPLAVVIGSPELSILAALAAVAATIGMILYFRRQRSTDQVLGSPIIEDDEAANPCVIPRDPVLADVLDDLRRELMGKLPSSIGSLVPDRAEVATDDLLIGERRLRFREMLSSEAARHAGRAELGKTPETLLLLALESGRWRTPEACKELLAIQKRVVDEIEIALRTEFIESAVEGERQRLADKGFVQEVLYAPPPSPGAPVYRIGIAPSDYPPPQVSVAVDRSYLSNSFYFLYLVEANASR